MSERYVVSDILVAWYGGLEDGRKLQGLSIFTKTSDCLKPEHASRLFRNWLVCSQTASGVASDLVGMGPAGHFDPLLAAYPSWFAQGNLLSCPSWEYQTPPRETTLITEVAVAPGPGPDLGMLIRKLGLV